jgi:hypothetical protein
MRGTDDSLHSYGEMNFLFQQWWTVIQISLTTDRIRKLGSDGKVKKKINILFEIFLKNRFMYNFSEFVYGK